jgi:hypothetical protein
MNLKEEGPWIARVHLEKFGNRCCEIGYEGKTMSTCFKVYGPFEIPDKQKIYQSAHARKRFGMSTLMMRMAIINYHSQKGFIYSLFATQITTTRNMLE